MVSWTAMHMKLPKALLRRAQSLLSTGPGPRQAPSARDGKKEGRKWGEGGRDPRQVPPHTPTTSVWPAVLTEKEPQQKARWAVGEAPAA